MTPGTRSKTAAYPEHDIVWLLKSPATVFYEYSSDEGALLKRAATEIEALRKTMTDPVQIPRKTLDAVREALLDTRVFLDKSKCLGSARFHGVMDALDAALALIEKELK